MSLHSNSVIHWLSLPASPACSSKIKKRYFKLEFDSGTKRAKNLTSRRQHEIMKWLSKSGVHNVNKNTGDWLLSEKNYFWEETKQNKTRTACRLWLSRKRQTGYKRSSEGNAKRSDAFRRCRHLCGFCCSRLKLNTANDWDGKRFQSCFYTLLC